MKFNSKKIYYLIIIIIGAICLIASLKILKSRNIYPSEGTIRNTLDLLIDQLYLNYSHSAKERTKFLKELNATENTNFDIKTNISYYAFPFYINYKDNKQKEFKFSFDANNNELTLYNIENLNHDEYNNSFYPNFISKFSLNLNLSLPSNETLDNIQEDIHIYRGCNIYIWIKNENAEEEINEFNTKYQEKVINLFYKLSTFGPIALKFIYYDNFNNIEVYTQVKNSNPKRLFDELNDKDLFNVHLINLKNIENVKTFTNSDLQSIIFGIDLDKHLNKKLYKYVTLLLSIQNYVFPLIKTDTFSYKYLTEENLIELVKIFNIKKIQKYLKFMAILKNCERISRIFPLYESILTIDKVKPKIQNIVKFLNLLVKSKFNKYYTNEIDEIIDQIYIDTLFLLKSNELVIFEHFFSFEFKIGQFLPVLSPILYALIKSFKALTS